MIASHSFSPLATLLTPAHSPSSVAGSSSLIASFARRTMAALVALFSGVLSSDESSSPTMRSSGKWEKRTEDTRAWQV